VLKAPPGTLAAHDRARLVLLSSLSDTVHGESLRKTQTYTVSSRQLLRLRPAQQGKSNYDIRFTNIPKVPRKVKQNGDRLQALSKGRGKQRTGGERRPGGQGRPCSYLCTFYYENRRHMRI